MPGDININFHVVDDPNTVNAFAIPGGDIYIYSGLLLQADTESEVVGVLGHEVAHVTERHIAERLVQTYGIQTLASVALGNNPGMLTQMLAGVAAQGYVLKYGRDQESEADRTGLKYTIDAGYDPQGMVTFFQQSSPKTRPAARPPSSPRTRTRATALKTSRIGSCGT